MKKLSETKLNQKENTFKDEYNKLKYGEEFQYQDIYAKWTFACQKITSDYAIAKNAYNQWIVFRVYVNCMTLGSNAVYSYATKDSAIEAINNGSIKIQ